MRRLFIALATLAACGNAPRATTTKPSTSYDDLVTLFKDFRALATPKSANGVPDYSVRAMQDQNNALGALQERLAAIDAKSWPIPQQVDYEIVRAEMNGLSFDHRVLRPWEKNPAYYISLFPDPHDVPGREGPVADGTIELYQYDFPLSADASTRLSGQLKSIPGRLAAAKINLTGNAKDLWTMGIRSFAGQLGDLDALAAKVAGNQTLLADISAARTATDEFKKWLEAEAPKKTGPSGVGVENYDWYLKYVHLVPYTHHDLVTLMWRELARATASLKLEEARNVGLPPLKEIGSKEEYDRRFNDAVTSYVRFLRDKNIMTVPAYADSALRRRIGSYSPPAVDRPREFFSQSDYRDPVVMRTHGFHWIDKAAETFDPHASPMRQVLRYNIFDTRAEGLATGMEEMMMHAGLFDKTPRSRELIWILLAQRAARALGDLMMHSNEATLEQAAAFASSWTPRGWMPVNSATVMGEQHLYLQQPTYGTSYVVGKIAIERTMAERSRQLGDKFSLREFMDALRKTANIPTSLIRWEMTGLDDEISVLRK